eukprot:3079557-Rhodomonas_salina.1
MPARRDACDQLPIPAVVACVQAATVKGEIQSASDSDVFLPWTRGPGEMSTIPVPHVHRQEHEAESVGGWRCGHDAPCLETAET